MKYIIFVIYNELFVIIFAIYSYAIYNPKYIFIDYLPNIFHFINQHHILYISRLVKTLIWIIKKLELELELDQAIVVHPMNIDYVTMYNAWCSYVLLLTVWMNFVLVWWNVSKWIISFTMTSQFCQGTLHWPVTKHIRLFWILNCYKACINTFVDDEQRCISVSFAALVVVSSWFKYVWAML